MKFSLHSFVTLLLLLYNCQVFGQAFKINLTSEKKEVPQGEEVGFSINVTQENNFSSSIYVEVLSHCYQSTISFNPSIINFPYADGTMTFKSGSVPPGEYGFIIHGYNGPVHSYDTVSIVVKASDDTSWILYNRSNSGISSDCLNSITIDSSGTIFFSTYNSIPQSYLSNPPLISFKGSSWHTWEGSKISIFDNCDNLMAEKESDLAYNGPSYLFTDKNDSTFYLANNKIYQINKDRSLTVLYDLSGYALDYSTNLFRDSKGVFWIPASNGLLAINYGTIIKYDHTNSGLSNYGISDITEDNLGRIWLVTDPPAVVSFDGTFWTTYNSTNSNFKSTYATSIACNSQGKIYVGGSLSQGMYKFDGQKWEQEYFYFPEPGVINCMKFDKKGHLYAGAMGGLLKYDGNNWQFFNGRNSGFTASKYEYAYMPNSVTDLALDPTEGVWLATNGEGLVYFNGKSDIVLDKVLAEEQQLKFDIFPNPSNGQLQITSTTASIIEKIIISNAAGNILIEKIVNEDNLIIDSKLNSGFYFMQILTSKGSVTKKILIK